jgi:hypothetical protein
MKLRIIFDRQNSSLTVDTNTRVKLYTRKFPLPDTRFDPLIEQFLP